MKLSCIKLGVKLFCVGFLFVATSLLTTKIYCNSNISQQSFFLEQFYFFTANQNLNNQHLISQQNKNLSISCKNIHVSLNEFCQDTVTVAALLADLYSDYSIFKLSMTYYGAPVPNPITKIYLGKTIMATVIDTTTGNSCWATILVEDKLAPTITCANDTVSCVKFYGTVAIDTPDVNDNCSEFTIRMIDEVFQKIDCNESYIKRVTRTWVAHDLSGFDEGGDTCVQEILLERMLIGDVDFPLNDTVYCDDVNLNSGIPDPSVTGVPLYDSCPIFPSDFLCYVDVSYKDFELGEINCVRKILRTWTVAEYNCNVRTINTMPQYIMIIDTTGPTISGTVPDATVSTNRYACTAKFTLPAIQLNDDCHAIHHVDVVYPGGILLNQNGGYVELPVGRDTIIYRAYDKCYNVSTDTMIITVEDKAPPVPVCEGKVIVSLPVTGSALAPAYVFNDGSFDDCGSITLQVRRMDLNSCGSIGEDDWGDDVLFCCADAGSEIMVALQVEDLSGNTSMCMVIAVIQDKTGPAITCPPNITIDCRFPIDTNNLSEFGIVALHDSLRNNITIDPAFSPIFDGPPLDGFVSDICPSTIQEIKTFQFNNCGLGSIERLFIATDAAGNTASCIQYISIINNNPIDLGDVDWPNDFDTSGICDPLVLVPELLQNPLTKEPITNDDICSSLGVSYEDKIFSPSTANDPCFKIFRIWKILDWCNRNTDGSFPIVVDTQIIKVENLIAPTIFNCRDTTICNFNLNCAPLDVSITLLANDDCTDSLELFYAYRIDLNSNNTIDISKSGVGLNRLIESLPIGKHTVHWTVEDRCSNLTNCVDTITINNCKAPSAYCLAGLAVAIIAMDTNGDGILDTELDTLYARDLDAGTALNCGAALRFSFSSNVLDSFRVYTCDSLGRREVNMYVTDAFGNQSLCRTFIEVQDNNTDTFCRRTSLSTTISGIVRTEFGSQIESAKIELQDQQSMFVDSDFEGKFTFGQMPTGGSYKLVSSKDDDYLNGITTADLVKIQKHILGLESFSSPYQMIAADVNDSRTITSRDISDIRKLILGVTSTLPINKTWKFIDSKYNFVNIENALEENWNLDYKIQNIQSDVFAELIGMKMGDVNASAKTRGFSSISTSRSASPMIIELENKKLLRGDQLEIPFNIASFAAYEALQTTLSFDQDKINILEIISNNNDFNDSNYSLNKLAEGLIPLSWNGVLSSPEIFRIKIEVKADCILEDIFKLNSNLILSEGYLKKNLIPTAIELRVKNGKSSHFSMEQNMPNPWTRNTKVMYSIPTDGNVVLRITSLEGRTIFEKKMIQKQGSHEWQITKKDVSGPGYYLYSIECNGQILTKPMVINE
jgi:hypothetical protein